MSATSPLELREALRNDLLERGFARVGFTGPQPVEDHATAWVAAGRHAGMEWMTREPARRAEPARLLPGVRSVVCVGAAYPATDGKGAVVGYARAEDYHVDLARALEDAAEAFARHVPELGWRVCVDAQPLAERGLAARAGLGWIGRNTMLLDETHGPWMLLAELLLDVELPADEPVAFRCGSCTACVDACPTEALDGAGGLDARRCLSYWSIEHRGELPEAWGRALGQRAFGCDDCLVACPFPNAEAAPSSPPLRLRPDLGDITPAELERRAKDSFKKHFGSTPLERARKGGLLRNLAWVAANSADQGM